MSSGAPADTVFDTMCFKMHSGSDAKHSAAHGRLYHRAVPPGLEVPSAPTPADRFRPARFGSGVPAKRRENHLLHWIFFASLATDVDLEMLNGNEKLTPACFIGPTPRSDLQGADTI